jgi:hypothetical protein
MLSMMASELCTHCRLHLSAHQFIPTAWNMWKCTCNITLVVCTLKRMALWLRDGHSAPRVQQRQAPRPLLHLIILTVN